MPLILTLLLTSSLGIGMTSCASTITSLLSASENLQVLAREETEKEFATPPGNFDFPPPPGVDPVAVAPRPKTDKRAWLPFVEALKDVASRTQTFDPPPEPAKEIRPGAQTEALRLYAHGRILAQDDLLLQANAELLKALELDPDNPRIMHELARNYIRSGNNTRAVAMFGQLIRHEPDNELALFIVGLAAAERRDYELTVATLGRPLVSGQSFTHDPGSSVLAGYHLARALSGLGYDRAASRSMHTSLERIGDFNRRSRYRQQLDSIFRRQAEMWQFIGDAYFRILEYEEALQAYDAASRMTGANLNALHPRMMYANLKLGRTTSAQRTLLESMLHKPESVGDREVLLCAYLYEHAGPVDLLAKSIRDLYLRHPDQAGLARAAASLLSDDEGLDILRDFISRRPRDLEVTSQLLTWIGNKNINGAVRLTADLVTDQPDLTQAYIRRLTHALPRPVEAIEHTQSKPASAALAQVRIGLFVQLGAIGEAWQASEAALRQWPTDSGLLISRIELAATLDEPALVDSAVAAADALRDDTRYMTVFARAWSKVGSHNRALEAARRAVKLDPDNSLAHGALARVLMSYAFALTEKYATLDRAEEAMVEARHAIDLDPGNEEPYEIITTLTGSGRLLDDLLVFNQTRLALHETNPNSRLYEKLLVADDIAQRNYEPALERLVNLYESDPTDTASLAQAVIAWTRANRLHDAERWLDEHLAVRPGDPGLLESRVRILLLQSRSDKAITLLKSDLETHPNNRTARRLLEGAYRAADDHQAVLELREPRLRLRPRGTRRELDLASMYADAGRYQQAQEKLKWVLAHAQEARREHLAGALNTARRLEIEESEKNALLVETTMRIVERFPDSPLSIYHVGLVAQAMLDADDDRFDWLADQASSNAIGAVQNTSQSMQAWRLIAQNLMDIDQPGAAGRVLRARLRADPDYENPTSLVFAFNAIALDTLTKGRARQSIQTIKNLNTHRKLNRRQMQNPLSFRLYRAGVLYSIIGNEAGTDVILSELVRLIEESGRSDSQYPMALNNLSYMRIASNRHDEETIRFMEQAYEMLPTDSNILDSIGWLRYKQGIFEDQGDAAVNKSARRGALSLIEESLGKNRTENPEVMDHLADALWRVGRESEATEIWKRVVEVVDDPARRKQYVARYLELQVDEWRIKVKDPEEIYEVNEGALLRKVIGKLEAISEGRPPSIALTFEEADQVGAAGEN